MKLKNAILGFLALLVIGCSSDDTGVIEEVQETPEADFTVVGEDLDNVYVFSYDAETHTDETLNLTDELGVLPSFLTLRQIDDQLSFYSFANGAFSIAQIDLSTGATANFADFFANNPDQSLVWGINDRSAVYFGFFGPFGTRNFAIQEVELQSRNSIDSMVDFDIDFAFQPLLSGDKVFLSYRDNQGNYKLTFYDTLTKLVGSILNFGNTPISILIDDSGNLAVVKNGVDATLDIYDSDDLTFLESKQLDFNSGFSPGPIDGAVLSDNKLFYALPFVQPARFSAGPAVFDFQSQENNAVNLEAIVNEVEDEINAAINLTTQIYSNTQNVFLIGYGILDDINPSGGVIQVSVDGKLVSNTGIPFIPAAFVRD